MTPRPGLIRSLIVDALGVIAIFALSAVPLFAQDGQPHVVALSEAVARSALPHLLLEVAQLGQTQPEPAGRLFASLSACLDASAELAAGMGYACVVAK